jgi:glycosyltransferase involved in cell wall biosynthesis
MANPAISLVITTYNEETTIEMLLESILNQELRPNEIIIVDAGSVDATVDKIRKFEHKFELANSKLTIIVEPKVNIAKGRNIGISVAEGPVIAVTDAGCILDKYWLRRLTEPIISGEADFVGGFFLPLAYTRFQKVLAALTTSHTPVKGFLPSSRSVAFKKHIWQRVGGYPEWLPWGEDTQFDLMCLRVGARYVTASNAIVYWEVRKTFRAALKQYFHYGFGDGLAARFSKSHLLIQAIYWTSILGYLGGLGKRSFAPLILYPFWLVWKHRRGIRVTDIPLMYLVAFGIHSARFSGFLFGLIKRARLSRL